MATATRQQRPAPPPHQFRHAGVRFIRNQSHIPGISALPSAPSGAHVTAGPSSLTVGWTAVQAATGYRVSRSGGPAGPFIALGTTTSTSFTDSTGQPGGTYYYQVTTLAANGESPPTGAGSGLILVAPSIANIVPAPGTPILPTDPVSFDVLAPDGLRLAMIVATINGASELVHDGTSFTPVYTGRRAVTADGFHYVINRIGGWPASPTITPYVVDLAGLQA